MTSGKFLDIFESRLLHLSSWDTMPADRVILRPRELMLVEYVLCFRPHTKCYMTTDSYNFTLTWGRMCCYHHPGLQTRETQVWGPQEVSQVIPSEWGSQASKRASLSLRPSPSTPCPLFHEPVTCVTYSATVELSLSPLPDLFVSSFISNSMGDSCRPKRMWKCHMWFFHKCKTSKYNAVSILNRISKVGPRSSDFCSCVPVLIKKSEFY